MDRLLLVYSIMCNQNFINFVVLKLNTVTMHAIKPLCSYGYSLVPKLCWVNTIYAEGVYLFRYTIICFIFVHKSSRAFHLAQGKKLQAYRIVGKLLVWFINGYICRHQCMNSTLLNRLAVVFLKDDGSICSWAFVICSTYMLTCSHH